MFFKPFWLKMRFFQHDKIYKTCDVSSSFFFFECAIKLTVSKLIIRKVAWITFEYCCGGTFSMIRKGSVLPEVVCHDVQFEASFKNLKWKEMKILYSIFDKTYQLIRTDLRISNLVKGQFINLLRNTITNKGEGFKKSWHCIHTK